MGELLDKWRDSRMDGRVGPGGMWDVRKDG